ncbi:MAG TPA: Asp-tRNA(Asn)/Glu-tRNA(Gln) amidotransferase subunit GatB [Chloroflexota bacterium]|nr:Asp-tRNA(Asn)/Glu-tRNA(Gln) amidotransferase subunit GatB [Chloroflexota bacterium]
MAQVAERLPAADPLADFEPVIGLEVHAQLLTASKMFCACSARYAGAEPNSRVCPICLGMPGVLPVINQKAVEFTILTALALNCEIPSFSKFDRKNYNYPDLMKGYQISQYDLPLSRNGWLEIPDPVDPSQTRRIGITRVHLEEDTADFKHVRDAGGEAYSLMDVNRSGVPLMEIVGEPDLRTPEEAAEYFRQLRAIVRYIEVSSGNLEAGAMRCDANISLRPRGSAAFGAKVEVKNMNSFRAVSRALTFEIERQAKVLRDGGRVVQETRGWVEEKGITVSQRSKEEAHDYRYFPEPDLPPLFLEREWVESIRTRLPELPEPKRRRFMADYGLSADDAATLTASRRLADFYEATVRLGAGPKAVANWMLREVLRLLNAHGTEIEASKLTPAHLAELIKLIDDGQLSVRSAPEVLEAVFESGASPQAVVKEKGLSQVSDASALESIVAAVLAAPENQKAIADYGAGKTNALGYLVGAVMKQTRGKANPGVVNQLLRQKLGGG